MKHEESAEQQALFQWARLQSKARPELALLFHIPNGQKLAGDRMRRARSAMRLKAEGMQPGVPDLCLPCSRGGYNGLFIELKRKDGGTVSPAQKAWIDRLQAQGYRALVCNGFEAARETILNYLENRQ